MLAGINSPDAVVVAVVSEEQRSDYPSLDAQHSATLAVAGNRNSWACKEPTCSYQPDCKRRRCTACERPYHSLGPFRSRFVCGACRAAYDAGQNPLQWCEICHVWADHFTSRHPGDEIWSRLGSADMPVEPPGHWCEKGGWQTGLRAECPSCAESDRMGSPW